MNKRFSKIYVEITNYCNLSCSFCSRDTAIKREMGVDEFKIVIKKIKNYTDSIYLHVKGEPLLHKKIDEILKICMDNDVKVNITTNGTLIENRKDILLKYPIKQINISLHSENDLANYFEKVFNACDELCKTTTIVYRIWTLPTLDLTKISTNIVEKIIKHYNLSTDAVEKIKKEKNIKISDNIYLDKDYEFKWPKLDDKKGDVGTCLGTKTHIGILANGDVVPCCLDSSGIIKLGNIFQDDLENIINSELFKMINKGFKNNQIVCDLCKSCTYRNRFKNS